MIPILVIRHAATDWNRDGRIQGRTDVPLSDAGRAEAATWRLPSGWADAHCLASPLVRAQETARLLGFSPEPEPLLIEMAWGEWEGRTLEDLRAELGAEMTRNEARGLDFRPAGGESPREVQERLRPLLRRLGPAVLVTHKGVIRAMYALAIRWTMAAKPPDKLRPGCAHLFNVEDGRVTVGELNLPLGGST